MLDAMFALALRLAAPMVHFLAGTPTASCELADRLCLPLSLSFSFSLRLLDGARLAIAL